MDYLAELILVRLFVMVLVILGVGYGLSHITISTESLLWLIFTSITMTSVWGVYLLGVGIDRGIDLLENISRNLK